MKDNQYIIPCSLWVREEALPKDSQPYVFRVSQKPKKYRFRQDSHAENLFIKVTADSEKEAFSIINKKCKMLNKKLEKLRSAPFFLPGETYLEELRQGTVIDFEAFTADRAKENEFVYLEEKRQAPYKGPFRRKKRFWLW